MVAEPGNRDVPDREDNATVEPLEIDDDLAASDELEEADLPLPNEPPPASEPPPLPTLLVALPPDDPATTEATPSRRRVPTANAVDPDDVRLGVLLREARRRRGLTLAEAHRDTRINPDYLEALEEERWSDLPAPVYARGFLRSYARHLGLDAVAVLRMMPANLPRPPGLEPSAGLRRSAGSSLPALPSLSRMSGTGSGGLSDIARANPRVVGALLAVVALMVLGYVVLPGLLGRGGDGEGASSSPTAAASGSTAGAGTEDAALSAATEAPVLATVPPFQPGETPSFIGVSRETAEATLGDLGLSYVVIEAATDEAAAGVVFGQSPQPGDALEVGADVTLIVSQGPP